MLNTWTASPKDTVIGISSSACGRIAAPPGGLDEEVEQHGVSLGLDHEHVSPGAQPREHRLADQRGQDGGHGRIDGVATLTKHVRPGLRGQGMASGNHAELGF